MMQGAELGDFSVSINILQELDDFGVSPTL